jgi:hypothetical protein
VYRQGLAIAATRNLQPVASSEGRNGCEICTFVAFGHSDPGPHPDLAVLRPLTGAMPIESNFGLLFLMRDIV